MQDESIKLVFQGQGSRAFSGGFVFLSESIRPFGRQVSNSDRRKRRFVSRRRIVDRRESQRHAGRPEQEHDRAGCRRGSERSLRRLCKTHRRSGQSIFCN